MVICVGVLIKANLIKIINPGDGRGDCPGDFT